jgi:NAD(P)-dependent dehydrogenase (short-subunit alcohol dehydrogenase family)
MPGMNEDVQETSMSTPPPFRLDGEIALVTGGGTGIGFAIARCFMSAGARAVIAGRREGVLVEACKSLGLGASYRVHDVCKFDESDALMKSVAGELGWPTILVNNAGTHLKKRTVETSVDEFRALMDTHVLAAHSLSRAVLPGMVSAKKGSILFIASMTSFLGLPQVAAYSAAKSAYLGMVRSMAADYSVDGVRVNAIAPGWIRTPGLDRALAGDGGRVNRILSRTPMRRFGDPAEVGWAAVYLCSPAASFVTGCVLPVDGGASIGF